MISCHPTILEIYIAREFILLSYVQDSSGRVCLQSSYITVSSGSARSHFSNIKTVCVILQRSICTRTTEPTSKPSAKTMTCPMTEAIDCLYQTAPHIILYEPTKPRSHKDLYRQMVASERQILEQSRKRRCSTFPQAVAKRACRWYHDFTHKVDPEEDMALSLSDSVRSNHLAACYDVNASSSHLRDAIRAREMMKASFDARKRESEKSAPIISGNNNFQEGQKNGVTVTVCANL